MGVKEYQTVELRKEFFNAALLRFWFENNLFLVSFNFYK